MTLKEAFAAGTRGQRIVCDGIVYKRILRVGYGFRENGTYYEYAEIAEMKTGTIVVCKPEALTLLVANEETLN